MERNGDDVSVVGQEKNCSVSDRLIHRIQSEYASSLDDVVPCTTVSSQDTNTSFRCHDAYFDSALPLFENRFELIPFKCFYPVTCHLYS